MAELPLTRVDDLSHLFGDRVSFDPQERRLYSHDVASLPHLIRPLAGDTTPDAVVQPENEDELVKLVRWAAKGGVPLTPRGKATAGYGGAVPVHKGIVVDMRRFDRLLSVDRVAYTATVQAGIVWERLDHLLEAHGLTVCSYPSSYPSSSVGGWLAQGGVGYGSWRHGWFRDVVVSARVVLPDGEVRELSGDELELVSDAEGITGFITQITIQVMPREELSVAAISCASTTELLRVMRGVAAAKLPVWSMSFADPVMVDLINACPPRAHPHEHKVELPKGYILLLAAPGMAGRSMLEGLPEVVRQAGATLLPDELARHDWADRFRVMRIKRIGPSLVPAEVVVPLSRLDAALDELGRRIRQPLAIEGLGIGSGPGGEPEVALLGFIPQDERTLGYDMVFGLSLSVVEVAERFGGRVYATGLFFRHKAAEVLGRERLEKLERFKRERDPAGVMNPGKVMGKGVLSQAISVAQGVEPLVRLTANRVNTVPGERFGSDVRGIPGDVAYYAYACAQCGYCVDECEQFYARGWESQSPRGKWFFLREFMEGREEMTQKMVDSFLSCTTCELCNVRCPEGLPIEPSWLKLRGKLIHEDKRMTFPPFEIMAAAVRAEGDIWAGYRKDRTEWFPEDLKEKHGPGVKSKNVYFAGCTASYVERDIGIGSVKLLDSAGVDFTYLGEKENCCATPMLVAGKWDVFVDTMKKNIEAVKESGADTVISSCPACDMMWRQVYPQWAKKEGIEYGITAKHYSELISEKLASGEFKFPDANGSHKLDVVTFHDSCHIGRASGVYEPPRDLIKALPGVELREMEHNRETSRCCGSVLTLIKDPDVAAELGKARLEEAVAVGAEKVVALCPCCEFQLRVARDARNVPVQVVDLSHLAAEKLGFTLPDPHGECTRNWAVFEKMVYLMTPGGFAGLMGTMWPEIFDAMPLGMGKMMRALGRFPWLLQAMRPMYGILFPILMPRMMPKLLPAMLDRIGQQVAMPDYMAEQMPDMMPGVMDTLLPHMIHDVVPLVTDPMIRYLSAPRA